MSDSLAGHKFRVAALSAQAERAIDVELACREKVGTRTKNALSRGKGLAMASVAGLALVGFLRHRRKNRADDNDHARRTRDPRHAPQPHETHKTTLLAKTGMAVLVLRRMVALIGPFMHGMDWAARRTSRRDARDPDITRAGE